MRTLRVAVLYPTLMNLYGDRGNIATLRERCLAREIGFELTDVHLGDSIDPSAHELVLMGGGQDREQQRCAADLREHKASAIHEMVADDRVMLAVCGGYQLFGHYYRESTGEELAGIGVFDAFTVHPGPDVPRCIGNLAVAWGGDTLVGFENHGGRTYLGSAAPLARVLGGFGNNGEDGFEGARVRNAFGSYLHPILPKNPRLADRLISLALERRYDPDEPLPGLDDRLEEDAHSAALAIALRRKR
jgi:CobQ-like glutamine amidotransferase family enzyme